MPARETGKEWTAEVLKEWLANKNLDLKEREGEAGMGNRSNRKKLTSMGALEENRILKQLRVNQSIDHALNSLKGYPPAPTADPCLHLDEYSFPPSSSRPDIGANKSCPRLLLPHILLADNISCTLNEIIILLVLGMVDEVHAQDSHVDREWRTVLVANLLTP
jgi:hypothetical protein